MAGIHSIIFLDDFCIGETAREYSHSSLHFVVGEQESLYKLCPIDERKVNPFRWPVDRSYQEWSILVWNVKMAV